MALSQYDPEKVVASFAPNAAAGIAAIDITNGAIAGSFLTVTKNNPRWAKEGDRAGNQTRVKNNDRSGTITVELSASSPTNAALSAAAIADDASEAVVGSVVIKDLNGTTLVKASGCYLTQVADASFGSERGSRTWVWECTVIDDFIGGHDVV
jgi:hypothetical protein